MKTNHQAQRRLIVQAGGLIACFPLAMLSSTAQANQNAGLRTALKYQDASKGEQKCGNCTHFIPGKSPADRGGCKIIPGDNEINPNGWCVSWVGAAKK